MSVTKGKSVLIVDDSTELLKLIDKILTNVGISTYTATSVSEAWKAIESSAPHAIITDLNMEPESGFVLLEKLKNNKKYATIPVIVLSAQGDRVAIHQAFGLGAKEYVKKPLDAALILQKVKKILHSSQFSTFEFTSENMPKIEAQIPVSIISGSAEALQIESSVRLTKDSSVALHAPILNSLKFSDWSRMRSTIPMPKINEKGVFVNEIRFLGLTELQIVALKEVIRKWHTQ